MRLAGQMKGGFYPCPDGNIKDIAKLLVAEDGCTPILDPCCGKGVAIRDLARGIGIDTDFVYGVELEENRAKTAQEALPRVCGPASFFDMTISVQSFGLVWLNPPYDDEAGGGQRTEMSFLARATALLCHRGVLAMYIPMKFLDRGFHEIPRYLVENFDNCCVITPREQPYKEGLFLGKRLRNRPTDGRTFRKSIFSCGIDEAINGVARDPRTGELFDEPVTLRFKIPKPQRPKRFEKDGPTEQELLSALKDSPLWKLTDPPKERPLARPPLPLSKGHVALLLASGHLDGVVHPAGETPHLVRGTAKKETKTVSVDEEKKESGAVTTTTVEREQIKLIVRTVDNEGNLRTYK